MMRIHPESKASAWLRRPSDAQLLSHSPPLCYSVHCSSMGNRSRGNYSTLSILCDVVCVACLCGRAWLSATAWRLVLTRMRNNQLTATSEHTAVTSEFCNADSRSTALRPLPSSYPSTPPPRSTSSALFQAAGTRTSATAVGRCARERATFDPHTTTHRHDETTLTTDARMTTFQSGFTPREWCPDTLPPPLCVSLPSNRAHSAGRGGARSPWPVSQFR